MFLLAMIEVNRIRFEKNHMTNPSIRPIGHSGQRHPSGTVTFLFTDIESSTQLWEQYPDAMKAAYARHESILREAVAAHNGYAYKMIGDAFQVAFETAPEALAAALLAQRALHDEPWPETGPL